MQVLYRAEIAWAAKTLTEKADQLKRFSEIEATTDIERRLYQLRAEQLQSIAERFTTVAANRDRRIAVR